MDDSTWVSTFGQRRLHVPAIGARLPSVSADTSEMRRFPKPASWPPAELVGFPFGPRCAKPREFTQTPRVADVLAVLE